MIKEILTGLLMAALSFGLLYGLFIENAFVFVLSGLGLIFVAMVRRF
jgi:hypothetical protein